MDNFQDVPAVEIFRGEKWLHWEWRALCAGDRFRYAPGHPAEGRVLRAMGCPDDNDVVPVQLEVN